MASGIIYYAIPNFDMPEEEQNDQTETFEVRGFINEMGYDNVQESVMNRLNQI